MASFSEILRHYYKPVKMGDEGGEPGADAAALRQDLLQRGRALNMIYGVIVVMVLVVFGIGIAVTMMNLSQPAVAAGVFSVLGVGVAGAIALMRSVAKEYGQVTLIAALCPQLNAAQLADLVNKMLAAQAADKPS